MRAGQRAVQRLRPLLLLAVGVLMAVWTWIAFSSAGEPRASAPGPSPGGEAAGRDAVELHRAEGAERAVPMEREPRASAPPLAATPDPGSPNSSPVGEAGGQLAPQRAAGAPAFVELQLEHPRGEQLAMRGYRIELFARATRGSGLDALWSEFDRERYAELRELALETREARLDEPVQLPTREFETVAIVAHRWAGIAARLDLPAGASGPRRMLLERLWSVSGSVEDQAGVPVGAEIFWESFDAAGRELESRSLGTDADGRFEFTLAPRSGSALPPGGSRRISALVEQIVRVEQPLDDLYLSRPGAAKAPPLTLVLGPSWGLDVQFLEPDGQLALEPLEVRVFEAGVWANDDGETDLPSATLVREGDLWTTRSLAGPGEVELHVRRQGARRWHGPFQAFASAGETAGSALRIELPAPSLRLTFTALDAEGAPSWKGGPGFLIATALPAGGDPATAEPFAVTNVRWDREGRASLMLDLPLERQPRKFDVVLEHPWTLGERRLEERPGVFERQRLERCVPGEARELGRLRVE